VDTANGELAHTTESAAGDGDGEKKKEADLKAGFRAAGLEAFDLGCGSLAGFGLSAFSAFWWHGLLAVSQGVTHEAFGRNKDEARWLT
jgi:hypothetical protein